MLPASIPLRVEAELEPRSDGRVRAESTAMGGTAEYELGSERPRRGWLDYVQGITSVLAAEGHALRGFDLRLRSALPPGAGLGSSAALCVAVLRVLREAFALPLDDLAIAELAHRAEAEFVGARVGLMDQLSASFGEEGAALLIDLRSLERETVPIPTAGELAVIHSGIAHAHAAGAYNTRRSECERACRLLGVASLRELGPADRARWDALGEPLRRRVRHVVTENERVRRMASALRAADFVEAGALLRAGQASLRDDYEVSVPEIDLLASIADVDPDAYGARLTGGGFGGSVLVLARHGSAGGVARRVAAAYAQRTGREATVVLPPI